LSIHKAQATGVDKVSVVAKNNDNLYDLSGKVDAYKDGYTITFIDSEEGFIEFANGKVVELGQASGGLNDEIQKAMIRTTVERHLEKESRFIKNNLGIKVLSVFFIDRVANYRGYDETGAVVAGKFALWFEEALADLLKSPRFKGLYEGFELPQLHDGYFSQDKNLRLKDSRERSTKDDHAVFELIMRDKERLLDINTPLRFIFSHSALREGWDNPNVFQICTLNETVSTVKKRQEIGRGLRLCVNQDGERVHDREVNLLTLVVNESYRDFANALQKEIKEDTGVAFGSRIKNARDKKIVRNKSKWLDDVLFIELWERIKHKTQYRVNYSTSELVELAVAEVKQMPRVVKPQIVRTLANVNVSQDGVNVQVIKGGSKSVDGIRYPIPDFLSFIQSKTELTRETVIKIIESSNRLSDVMVNPQMFMEQTAKAINDALDKLKIENIKYEKIADSYYQMQIFEIGEIERFLDNLVPVKEMGKTLYDHIEVDSTIERAFAQDCEAREDILFYVKLPRQFKIKTPLGNYNPDWALIKRENEDAQKVYFIAETKGEEASRDKMALRFKESGKIECGKKHFELFKEQVIFKVVSEVNEL
jgi:type III restriction enzyme